MDASTVYRTLARLGWLNKKSKVRERDTMGMWKATLPRDEHGNAWYGPVKDIGKTKRKRNTDDSAQSKTGQKNEKLLNRVESFVKSYMSQPRFDASHDYAHVLRVVNLAKHILEIEQNLYPSVRYEPMIVQLAALLHDVEDRKYAVTTGDAATESQAQPPAVPASNRAEFPSSVNIDPSITSYSYQMPPSHMQSSVDQVHRFLSSGGPSSSPEQNESPSQRPPVTSSASQNPDYDADSLEAHFSRLRVPKRFRSPLTAICSAVSYSKEMADPQHIASVMASHPELAIVQDADRLDALGATGLSRAFTYGATTAPERGLEGSVGHMDEKLLRLEGMMKTGEGRRLAKVRTERIRAFRAWWDEEMAMVGQPPGFSTSSSHPPPAPAVAPSGRAPQAGHVAEDRSEWHGANGASAGARNSGDDTARQQQRRGVSDISASTGYHHALATPQQQEGPGHGQAADSDSNPNLDNPDRQLMMEAGMLR